MQVNSIKTYNTNITSFKSCVRQYPAGYGCNSGIKKGQVLTSTSLFRDDLDWKFLRDLIINNFKDKKQINTYCLACSDGSEAYSYVISLMDKLPEKEYIKYFPIMASDTDYESIRAANTGRINLGLSDFMRMKENVKSFDYFIDKGKPINISNNKNFAGYFYNSYKPINKLKNAVIFNQSDLLNEIKLIKDDGNSVIMARNVALYLKNDYIEEIAKTAGKILKKGSLFITGECDAQKSYLIEELVKNGFEEIKPLILRKK